MATSVGRAIGIGLRLGRDLLVVLLLLATLGVLDAAYQLQKVQAIVQMEQLQLLRKQTKIMEGAAAPAPEPVPELEPMQYRQHEMPSQEAHLR
jgi:hypothetical protein